MGGGPVRRARSARRSCREGVAGQIPAVRWFSASGHINGGLRGTIRAEARDEQAGQNLRDVVQGFLALAKMQAEPEAGADRR